MTLLLVLGSVGSAVVVWRFLAGVETAADDAWSTILFAGLLVAGEDRSRRPSCGTGGRPAWNGSS